MINGRYRVDFGLHGIWLLYGPMCRSIVKTETHYIPIR